MSEMSLLAPIPHKSRDRADKRMIKAMSDIARRVAMKAMAERKPDVFLEVYAAGLAHAATLSDRPTLALSPGETDA